MRHVSAGVKKCRSSELPSKTRTKSHGGAVALMSAMALIGDNEVNRVSGAIIAAGIEVHRALGPGLMESAYLTCMVHELTTAGFVVEIQKPLPLAYKGLQIDCAYRVDLIVGGCVVVELKCVSEFAPVHRAQLLTYLKLTGCPLGLLLNFHVPVLKQGICRVLNSSRPAPGEPA
jgi:GxxExxY protein